MPAITDELMARYNMPVWPHNRGVVIKVSYLVFLMVFAMVYVVGSGDITLMVMNTSCLIGLFATYMLRQQMKSAAYALLMKTLQLFILNSLRGSMLHHACDQLKHVLELFPGIDPHASHIASLVHAIMGAVPEYLLLSKAVNVAKASGTTAVLKGLSSGPPSGFVTFDNLHTLLRDSAWSSPMFWFVVNPVSLMLAAYLGTLVRKVRGTHHEDVQDVHEDAAFFIFWSLCPTFIFASGTRFVELFVGLPPPSATEQPKLKIRNEDQQEHFDPRVASGLKWMTSLLLTSCALCVFCWILMSFMRTTTHHVDATPADTATTAADPPVNDTLAISAPLDDGTATDTAVDDQGEPKPHNNNTALVPYYRKFLMNTMPVLASYLNTTRWRRARSWSTPFAYIIMVIVLSYYSYISSFENLQNMRLYITKTNYKESFLGLWLLPLQDRFPETLVSLVAAFKDQAHGNVWDGLADSTLSGLISLGFVLPLTILPLLDELKPTFVSSPTYATLLLTCVIMTVILIRCHRHTWFSAS